MNRRYWLLAMGLGLLGFVIGGLLFGAYRQSPVYIPPLKVVGDVARVVRLEDLQHQLVSAQEPSSCASQQLGKLHNVIYEGRKYQALKLLDIIDAAQPIGPPKQIYLVGSDGFTSSFPAQGLEKSYITFTAQNGWEAINLNHPVSSNAKVLKEIIIVAEGGSSPLGLTVINSEKELSRVTTGQLYTRTLLEYPYAEGQAAVENEGQTYTSSVYTLRKVFRLADLTPIQEGGMMLVMGGNGEQRFLENRGYFELKDNCINYLDIDERSQMEEIKGVIVNPPTTSIMDTYYDARHYMENGDKVLVVVLEGFTYSLYTHAIEKGHLPFLENVGPAQQATGVYPLEHNVWLAAMITGAVPAENGVVNAKDQDLKVSSLFAVAQRLKMPALLLQSDAKLLNTEVEPLLINDQNTSGTADDELYALTLDKLEQDYDFIMVCLDGIASSSESHGSEAEPALAALHATDKYLQGLVKQWPGKVIITGSPGKTGQKEFTCDSIFVPYLYLK